MLARIRYALSACYTHRAQMLGFLSDPGLQSSCVTNLLSDNLVARGVKGLVLDFDGVLAAHGASQPLPEVQAWLEKFELAWAPNLIFILSNKPTLERQEYFAQHFPRIIFVIAKRKKPFPEGLQEILLVSGLAPDQILVVDDRLATGVVAAAAAGVQGCWITHPYVDLQQRPVAEGVFVMLRWLERKLISCLGG